MVTDLEVKPTWKTGEHLLRKQLTRLFRERNKLAAAAVVVRTKISHCLDVLC